MTNLKVWDRGEESNDIEGIINYLKNIRNKYTHEGSRVYYMPPDSGMGCAIMVAPRLKEIKGSLKLENRTEKMLIVNPGFDLVLALKKIAVQVCKKEIEKITKYNEE